MTMRKQILAIAALLAPAAAFAGGYVVPNINPRDMSMAGSVVAGQEDAAATYANPSALSKLDGLNLSLGGSVIDFRSTWTDTTLTYSPSSTPVSSTMIPKAAFPPALYAAYGTKLSNDMRLGVGAGLTIPGGGFVFWEPNWPGRYDILNVDRKVYGMYLTAGLQPIKQLRVGGGLVYYRTTEHLTQRIPIPNGPDGTAQISTSGGQLSYDLSAEITPLPEIPVTFAIDYKHQAVQNLSGHAVFSNIPDPLRPSLLDQNATHVLTFPNQLNVGLAVRPIQPLLITGAWTWERFHVYQSDVFAGDLGTTVTVVRDYKNGYTFRLGAELQALPMLKVRAGILRDISPSRNETLAPSLPDASSWAYTVGLGFNVNRDLEINAAYFHDTEDTAISTRPEFPGAFDTRANIFSLAVVWRFGGTPQ